MATTIITKHGTGAPTSLAVGELAIDKSGPTLYTNTGGGVEAFSSGGGSTATLYVGQAAPFDLGGVTYGGTLASQCTTGNLTESNNGLNEKLGFIINKPNSLVWGATDNLIIYSPPGTAFKIFVNLTDVNSTTFKAHYAHDNGTGLNSGRLINVGTSGNDVPVKFDFRRNVAQSDGISSGVRSFDNSAELLSGSSYICTGFEIKGPIGGGKTSATKFAFNNFHSIYI